MSAIHEQPTPDLAFSGRETNHALGFRRWDASSHASYYTSLPICRAIFKGLEKVRNKPVYSGGSVVTTRDEIRWVAFDPTCGSGRLLLPFKEAGHSVLGIELDEDAVPVAKQNLGARSVRAGDVLLYRNIFRKKSYEEGFNLVVTNPPYGLWWHVPEGEGWATVNDGGTVESQAFTLELATKALNHGGYLVAVLPSSTFWNDKDSALRKMLYKEYALLGRIAVEHAFKEEYGIDVAVDILIARREAYGSSTWRGKELVPVTLDASAPGFEDHLWEGIADCLRDSPVPPTAKGIHLPQAQLFVTTPISTALEVTAKGAVGEASALALLDFLNATVLEYSPVQGTRVGIADAYLSAPALIKRGTEEAVSAMTRLGFSVTISEKTAARIERQRKRYARLTVPLYRPKAHQLLGYLDDRPYEATSTVAERVKDAPGSTVTLTADGPFTVLWEAGKSYHIHPTWIRRREEADRKTTYNETKKREETTVVEIDRGYLLLEVQTEKGTLSVPEVDEHAVKTLLRAFPLPVVEDVDDTFTEEVERNRSRLDEVAPYLYPYQREDVARLLTKPRGYIGWEVGGGKTSSSIAWAKARGYRRTLVLCESRLVKNWLAECEKFGAEGHPLITHEQVSDLRERIRRGEKPTGFYVTSYEFVSLDGSRSYEPWDCVQFDDDGKVTHEHTGLTEESCPDCSATYASTVRACPKCSSSEEWSGCICRACGFIAYTYDGRRRQRPAYRTLKRLFPCVIADEAQVAKSKLSRRGQALRAIQSKGRLVLTATIFKGFVHDLFWLVADVLRWNNPLFPFPYRGGAKRFLDCYGTYKFVTRQFADTLHTGKAQIIPEVSSLNLFGRMMAPFMVRRVDGEMAELPPKHRHVLRLPLDRAHEGVYRAWEDWATDRINKELAMHQGEDVNMGVISQCLWALRFASSVPTSDEHLRYEGGPGTTLTADSWNKLAETLRIVREVIAKGERILLTAPLRPLVAEIGQLLKREGIAFTSILASTPVHDRHDIVSRFNQGTTPVLLASMGAICRGLNITGANHIIVQALEWSPEVLTQVCGRLHRPGQTREVHEYILLGQGTIDEDMYDLCEAKERALREAIDAHARYRTVADILESMTKADQLEVAKRVASRPRQTVVEDIAVPPAPLPPPPQHIGGINAESAEKWERIRQELAAARAKKFRSRPDDSMPLLF